MHYWQRKTQAVNPLGCRIAFLKDLDTAFFLEIAPRMWEVIG